MPRSAVLMAGNQSVVYVETEPGRFEIRRVVLGPSCGDQIAILSGVKEGEQVATKGNFLIDSQMQLAGNPSLIDPTKAVPRTEAKPTPDMLAALKKLPEATIKRWPAGNGSARSRMHSGRWARRRKVDVKGKPVFHLLRGSCRESLLSEPEKYLAKLEVAKANRGSEKPKKKRLSAPIGEPASH